MAGGRQSRRRRRARRSPTKAAETGVRLTEDQIQRAVLDRIRAIMIIRAYRIRGHLAADLDPLGMTDRGNHPELDPASYGFTEADMDRPIFIDNVLGLEIASMRADHRHREAHLLRHLRAAVHAHLRPRAGRLAEGTDRRLRQGNRSSPAKAARRS